MIENDHQLTRSDMIDILIDVLYTKYVIYCNDCGKVKTSGMENKVQFAIKLYEEGWRGYNSSKHYCPTCIKINKNDIQI
jgi:hypothetical protein